MSSICSRLGREAVHGEALPDTLILPGAITLRSVTPVAELLNAP